MKWLYKLRYLFKKSKPLINKYNSAEIDKLNILIEKYKNTTEEFQKEIDELRLKIINLTQNNIIKNILSCKTVFSCEHESCDFSVIIKEYTDKINFKDNEIKKLQYNFLTNIYNLNNEISWYTKNYQKLLDYNELLKNDNRILVNSLEQHINNCVTPEGHRINQLD